MPKWWPWTRTPRTAPAAPAMRAEPAWHRLAPIQRTVGAVEPTAQWENFPGSLTTSQNPALTGPIELLAADPGQLPVLNWVRESATADAAAAAAHPAATERSRTWTPRIPRVQRAQVGSNATFPQSIDTQLPHTYPVAETGIQEAYGAPAAPGAMVEASEPDDDRTLPVVLDQGGPAEPTPTQSGPPEAAITPSAVTVESASGPAVQRTAAAIDSVHPVVQRVSTTPANNTGTAPTPRPLPSVQRLETSPPLSTPRTVAAAAPVTRTPSQAGVASAPPDGAGTVQLATDPGAACHAGTDTHAPTAVAPASLPGAAPKGAPDDPPIGVRTSLPAASPAVAAQRMTSFIEPAEPTPTPPLRPAPQPGDFQRLPIAPARPASSVNSAPRHTDPPTAQRSATVFTPNVPPAPADQQPRVQRSSGSEARRPPAAGQDPDQPPEVDTSTEHPTVTVHITDIEHAARRTPEFGVAQRITPPATDPPPRAHSERLATSALPAPPVIQRTDTRGRLKVLPPVRSSGGQEPPGEPPGAPAHTVVFSSPRPVGLQRMFANTATPAPTRTRLRSAPPGSGFGSATDDPGSGTPPSLTPDYDATANTITFASATVQREQDVAPPPEPMPAESSAVSTEMPAESSTMSTPIPTAAASAAPVAAAPAPGTDIDELVNRLYDPLAARLRAELWLDRERAGVLMDLHQ